MASTDISIRQSTGVAINVAVLKAITIETLQAIKQRVLSAVAYSSLFTLHSSLIRLYRQELHLARALARMIDKHPALSNIALWLMGIGIMVEIFMFV